MGETSREATASPQTEKRGLARYLATKGTSGTPFEALVRNVTDTEKPPFRNHFLPR